MATLNGAVGPPGGLTPSPDIRVRSSVPQGRWDPVFEEGVIGVHAALLHTNEVLFWSYHDDGVTRDVVAHGEWSLLDLATGRVVARETTERNLFCSGQCLLGDGSVLVVGGDRNTLANVSSVNARSVMRFHPVARSWEQLADLETGRWYPTVVTYGATTAIAVAGRDRTSSHDSDHRSAQSALFVAQSGLAGPRRDFDPGFVARDGEAGDTYPFVFVLPGGHLFVHLANQTRLPLLPHLDFLSARKATDSSGYRTYDRQGTAVLLPLRPTDSPPYRARVMMIGGGLATPGLATSACVAMDAGALAPSAVPAAPQWVPAAPLHDARHMGDAVLLPDGQVLVVNGVRQGQTTQVRAQDARRVAEMYDPVFNHWAEMAPMATPRLYHSTALLLPDGRVLAAGTDRTWNILEGRGRPNLEAFSPPYLFQGPRPRIRSAPPSAGYGETFLVATDEAESIGSAVLVRNGTCTHSFNGDQRLIELEILERRRPAIVTTLDRVVGRIRSLVFTFRWPNLITSRALLLRTPPNELVAPAGYYMLFLVSDTGVPSVAQFIRIGKTREPWFTVTRVEGRAGRG